MTDAKHEAPAEGAADAWRIRTKENIHGDGAEPGRWMVMNILNLSSDTAHWYEVQPLRASAPSQADLNEMAAYGVTAALTPRHEAPAEGAGEREAIADDLLGLKAEFQRIAAKAPEDQPRYADGVRPFGTGDLQHFIAVLSKGIAALRARSSALEAHDVLALCRAISDDYQTSETHHPDHVLVRKDQFDALVSILNRQPEAREGEAVAWRWRKRDDAVWNYQEARQVIPDAICEPLYTHPAAPSADKLRIAVEDIVERVKTGAQGSTVQALGALSDIEQIALASLKAEGA